MAGGGDDIQPVALQVVVGVCGCGQLVLAAVAGAGVHVSQRERAGAGRETGSAISPRMRLRCLSSRNIALAVRAGVAELEALVDQGEVGEQVFAAACASDGPVGVGAGAQVQPRERVPLASDGADRLAARALDPRDTDRLGRERSSGLRRPDRTRPTRSSSTIAKVCSSSSWRTSRRAMTSPRGCSSVAGVKLS